VINAYIAAIDKIYRSGKGTEHSYRPALKNLLEGMARGLTFTNEPKRIECGAPDFIASLGDIPVGYLEAKDIPVGLDNKLNREQFDRYKASLNNLIITDYLTFQLFVNGELAASVSIAGENAGAISPEKKNYGAFAELIGAFAGFRGKTITQSEALARMMAAKTKLLAEIIEKALSGKQAGGDALTGQLEGFRLVLIHDLSVPAFADIYAQTLAYGMFAARLKDRSDEAFTRKKAADLIPLSNPFLRRFFQYIAAWDLDSRIAWAVDALAELFNCVSVGELLKEFEQANQDPYIHFYETFLGEYNPELRESRGVYYTPLPVVKFIVRAVDDILQKEFNLPRGLADNSKIKRTIIGKGGEEGGEKGGGKGGKKKEAEFHKVQILDPAAGTGTFLAEVIDCVYQKFAKQKGAWPNYCSDNLIPRLHGFEILMAPYAMAHMKLDMKLKESGFEWDGIEGSGIEGSGRRRIHIYLTNSLEEPEAAASKLPMVKWLTDEAEEATLIKREVPLMVVLGNPPYSGESYNKTKDEFLHDYKMEPGGVEKLKEKNPKWLNDDYVKFIRLGQKFIERNESGILAYISNNSFLDNPTFRGMRWNLLKSFDMIYILDLHGSAKKREAAPGGGKDENVFNIQQGASINIFIKKVGKNNKSAKDGNADKSAKSEKTQVELAKVYHQDLFGTRKFKFSFLGENTLSTIRWTELAPKAPQYFFVPKDFGAHSEYESEKWFGVDELFPVNSVGVVTARDDFTIHDSEDAVKETITEFMSLDDESTRAKFKLGRDARDWSVAMARKDLLPEPDFSKIVKIDYRPFDTRYTYYTGRSRGFHCMPRGEVMRHFLHGDNIGLITIKRGRSNMPWSEIFIGKHIVSGSTAISSLDINYVFPLYLYPGADEWDTARRPNLEMSIAHKIATDTGLRFVPEKAEGDGTFSPIDLLDYIYAVLYSPCYRETYREYLKINFPRVPYPESAEMFRSLAAIGASLRKIHLLEGVEAPVDFANYPVSGNNLIGNADYKNGNVYINKEQYFENIPHEVWDCYIGGYQPARKWLKDRKGRTLGFDGIEHYQKIIAALKLTIDISAQLSVLTWELGVGSWE